MIAHLFNRVEAAVYFVTPGKRSKWGHTFGGLPSHRGTVLPVGPPLHLFFTLNLTDPRVGLRLPRRKWLPFFYPFRNIHGEFAYRVVSDGRVEVLSKPYSAAYLADESEWFHWPGFPRGCRRRSAGLEKKQDYDVHDPEDVYWLGCIFGVAALSASEKEAAKERLENWYRESFESEMNSFDSLDELAAESSGFLVQGLPRSKCPNRKCRNHKRPGSMEVVLTIIADEGDSFAAEIGDTGQLIYEVCRICGSVFVHNQCT